MDAEQHLVITVDPSPTAMDVLTAVEYLKGSSGEAFLHHDQIQIRREVSSAMGGLDFVRAIDALHTGVANPDQWRGRWGIKIVTDEPPPSTASIEDRLSAEDPEDPDEESTLEEVIRYINEAIEEIGSLPAGSGVMDAYSRLKGAQRLLTKMMDSKA